MKIFSLIFCISYSTLIAAQLSNLQCGQISHLKRTVIENPTRLIDFCQYTIEAYNSHACQLLINFERFELRQPTLRDGILECTDYFQVGDFKLCGNNDQQHLYIRLEKAAYNTRKGRVTLNLQLPSRWSQSHWKLVITQLECAHTTDMFRFSNLLGFGFLESFENASRTLFPPPSFGDLDLLAPEGCQQYFTLPTGTIRSFNFNSTYGTLYMPNMKYVICIKAAEGVQKIDYTFERFSMSIQDIAKAGFDFDCHVTIFTPGRRSDFLMIPQSTMPNLPALTPVHYCGRSLDGHQVIASLPFLIYFQSDEQADPTETGFIISYRVK